MPVFLPSLCCGCSPSPAQLSSALIIGAPGSGKGTISAWIVREYGLVHVSSGDLLRAQIRDKSPLGLQAREYITRGDLVPDSVMVGLVTGELAKHGHQPWLLDGFPRTLPQAEALQARAPVQCVIYLAVPFENIIERLQHRWIHPQSGRVYNLQFNPPLVPGKDDDTGEDLEQREDDKPESVKKRLEVFQASTEPMLEYYREQGVLREFPGTDSSDIWIQVKNYITSNTQS